MKLAECQVGQKVHLKTGMGPDTRNTYSVLKITGRVCTVEDLARDVKYVVSHLRLVLAAAQVTAQ